jgi:alpha-amylase
MQKIIRIFFIFHFSLISYFLVSQDVMMQGWYWDFPKTCDGYNWADTMQSKVSILSNSGITYLWLPPTSRTNSGDCSNGYDPKDLFDLGNNNDTTHFGSRAQLDNLISSLNTAGINTVADVVYNHRDGGKPENNSAVEDYIEQYMDNTKNAYPSDRFRCILPIGGTTGHGAGDYYFKISSKTGDSKYYDKPYKVYMETNTVGWQGLNDTTEVEPNGGGDCGEGNNTIALGRNWMANVDGLGCKVDEFHLYISASDFDSSGDTIFIYLTNLNGDYSDHRIYGIWSGAEGTDIVNDLRYQTWTDFNNMPSGRGDMDFEFFKPNSVNKSYTKLDGFWDWLWWFYDYDQDRKYVRDTLIDWSKWLWSDVGYRGFRMDAVKHFPPDFVSKLLDSLHFYSMDPGMVVGEYFDSNSGLLKDWVDDVLDGMTQGAKDNIHPRLFDFALRQALKDACDGYHYDRRNVFKSGMVDEAGCSGYNVVTFLNNHDFRNSGEPIQNDALLAYAYILTNNKIGLPCIYYPDYFGDTIPNAPVQNLGFDLDMLIEVQNNYIAGASQIDYINRFNTPYFVQYQTGLNYQDSTTLIYQIKGGGNNNTNEVVVVINFAGDSVKVEFELSNFTALMEGDTLYDILGKSWTSETIVDAGKHCTVFLPGRSYSVWVNNPVQSSHLDTVLYVDWNATGYDNGQNWENALTSLSSAIELADHNPQITEIWVREGTYYPNVINDRTKGFKIDKKIRIYGSFPSTGNPDKNDRDTQLHPSILSGDIGVLNDNSDNVYHVVYNTSNEVVTIDGFKIQYGNADGTDNFNKRGAGVYNVGKLTLKGITISGVDALSDGSHLYNTGSSTILTVNGSKFINNASQSISTIVNNNGALLNVENNNSIEN